MSWMRHDLAEHIRELRKYLGMTQAAFASALGVERCSIMRAEDAGGGMPCRRFFQKLSSLPDNDLSGRTQEFIEWGLRLPHPSAKPRPKPAAKEPRIITGMGWVRAELADHLRLLRSHLVLSQEEFAGLLNLSARTIRRAERADSGSVPSRALFRALLSLPETPFTASTQKLAKAGLGREVRRRRDRRSQ